MPEDEYSISPSLTNHFIVISMYGLAGLLMGMGVPISSGASLLCADSIGFVIVILVCTIYGHLLTSVPELMLTSFTICVKTSVKKSINWFSKKSNVEQFCQELENIYWTLRNLESVFGSSILVLASFHTMFLIANIYFAFIMAIQMSGLNKATNYMFMVVQVFFTIGTLKRLLHVANHMQYLLENIDKAVVNLILVDVDHPQKARATQVKMLLEKVDGLSALGFFSLKRGILLAIISNILTYLIILIEFKMDN